MRIIGLMVFIFVLIAFGLGASLSDSGLTPLNITTAIDNTNITKIELYRVSIDEGTIIAGVELLPLSSPDFESGPPSLESIELARSVVDRGLRESHAINPKKLCIKEGEHVWLVYIDVYSMNDCGNLADAIGLAALAAVKDAKMPKQKDGVIDYKEKSTKSLPLTQLPIPITLIKIKDKILVDPCLEEEEAMEARLTVTTVEDGRVCALQKGGDLPLSVEDVDKMIELAIQKGKELRKLI